MAKRAQKSLVLGVKEIDAMMAKLDRKLQTKIVRDGLKAGMDPMLKAAQAKAPIGRRRYIESRGSRAGSAHVPGSLRKAIKIRAGARRKGYIRRSIVVGKELGSKGTASESGLYRGDTYYAGFVEYGLPKSNPRYPRQQFMRPAFDTTKDYTRDYVMKHIRDKLIAATRGGA